MLMDFCQQKGIKIAEPKYLQFDDEIEAWMECFTFLAESDVQMVMLIDKKEDKTHGRGFFTWIGRYVFP